MIDEVAAVLPSDVRSVEVQQLPPVELPAVLHAPLANPEQIQAIDQAFVGNKDKTDAVAGLMGLWLSAPWLADLVADQFRPAAEAEDEMKEEEPRLKDQE